MGTVHAIFENGVFRPTKPVELPEAAEVEFEPRLVTPPKAGTLEGVYRVLSQRFESGERDVAARHEECRP